MSIRGARSASLTARLAALVLALILAAAACSRDNDTAGDNPAAGADGSADGTGPGGADADGSGGAGSADPNNPDAAPLGDGSLGFVTVPAGDAVQIRLVQANRGALAPAGNTAITIAEMALANYGDIHGFQVEFGTPISDPCKPDAAEAIAYEITADTQVVGIIGPTCSASSVALVPVISEAGLVAITSSSTSTTLTSDLNQNPSPDYNPGFYRTAPNDITKAEAIAQFLYTDQNLRTAAALHTGNADTRNLAQEFAAAFERLGGTITATRQAIGTENLLSAAAEIATASPQAVLLAIYPPADTDVLGQLAALPALQDTVLVADGTVGQQISNEQTLGMFFVVPNSYDNNPNQATQVRTQDLFTRYFDATGEPLGFTTWAQAYDATTLLLDAVAGAAYVNDDGNLVINRQGIRQWLNQADGYQGLASSYSCDNFGDCSFVGVRIAEQTSSSFGFRVVFQYSPSS